MKDADPSDEKPLSNSVGSPKSIIYVSTHPQTPLVNIVDSANVVNGKRLVNQEKTINLEEGDPKGGSIL